jgi:hypothetical protein
MIVLFVLNTLPEAMFGPRLIIGERICCPLAPVKINCIVPLILLLNGSSLKLNDNLAKEVLRVSFAVNCCSCGGVLSVNATTSGRVESYTQCLNSIGLSTIEVSLA